MNLKRLIPLILAAVLVSGCLPSLHPLGTKGDRVYRPELVGKWKADDEDFLWAFAPGPDDTYRFTFIEDDDKISRFHAALFEIDDRLYLDIFPDPAGVEDIGLGDYYRSTLYPTHLFWRVDQIDPVLKIRLIDVDDLPEKAESLKPSLGIVRPEEAPGGTDVLPLITADTKTLQEFFAKHGDEEGVFGDAEEMARLRPIYAAGDVVSDAALAGRWISPNGDMLLLEADDGAYTGSWTSEASPPVTTTFDALPVRKRGRDYLAILISGRTGSGGEVPEIDRIPWLMLGVDQTEPTLRLQVLPYQLAAEVLDQPQDAYREKTKDVYTLEMRSLGSIFPSAEEAAN